MSLLLGTFRTCRPFQSMSAFRDNGHAAMSDLSAWGAIANGSRECAPDDKLRVLRRPACNKLAEYAALFRPCNSGIDYRWCVPKGMACRGVHSAAGRWRSDRVRPEPLLAAP